MLLKYGLLIISYLIGAIPFSVILGIKLKGIDVREHGSGNPGGTNSLRYLGKRVGLVVIFFDILKGAIFVIITKYLIPDSVDMLHPLAYGFAATIGHVFSVYIKFRGGKAVATGGGMIIAFNPLVAVVAAAGFFITLKISKYVSLASTMAAVTMFITTLFLQDFWFSFFGGITMLIVIYRHKVNYQNIKAGKERKVYWM